MMLCGSRYNAFQLGFYSCNNNKSNCFHFYKTGAFQFSSAFILSFPISFGCNDSQSCTSKGFFSFRLLTAANHSYSCSSVASNNSDDPAEVSFIKNDYTSSRSTNQTPLLLDCFSPAGDVADTHSERLSSVAGGIVALGKFDALHLGHRELAVKAAKIGVPFLLSFVGMAEILGWEPRASIVAKCDRNRILSSWAPLFNNVIPKEFQIEFSKVRYLTPRQFVEKLSDELRVSGVVAGRNYRFGYKAAGDSSDLARLCEEFGMSSYIINPVMDKNQDINDINCSNSKEQGQVSSTRVRHALATGDMEYVSELLGRHHRLLLMNNSNGRIVTDGNKLSASVSCSLNLPPKVGLYENCSLLIGEENVAHCRVIIDTTYIHLELYDSSPQIHIIATQNSEFIGIDFGNS